MTEINFLRLLKNIQGFGDVDAEDIAKWIANDEVGEFTENDNLEMATPEEVTRKR